MSKFVFVFTLLFVLPASVMSADAKKVVSPKHRKKISPSKKVDFALQRKVFGWILLARQFASRGNFGLMERALKKAEKRLEEDEEKLLEQDKQNVELWLHLLWSKLYRTLGVLPSIRALEEYEDRRDLESQKSRLEEVLEYLQKGLFHLKKYNRVLKRVQRKAHVKEALVLVHSVNQEGILNNQVMIVQLRIFRLKRILVDWKKKRLEKEKHFKQAERETKRLQRIRSLQVDMKSLLKRQGHALKKTERLYQNLRVDLQRRERTSTVLAWTGVALLGVGSITGGAGFGVFRDADGWEIEGERKKYSLHETVTRRQVGAGLIISGAGFLVGGGALLLIGQLLKPRKFQYYKGMFRSHQNFLEWEERERMKPQAQNKTNIQKGMGSFFLSSKL